MATKKSSSTRRESGHCLKTKTSTRLDEVLKENIQLKKLVENLQEESKIIKNKLEKVSERLVSNVDTNDYNFDYCDSYSGISSEDLVAMVSDIACQKDLDQEEHYLESRLEEVETRITQISTEFAKLVQLKLRLENGLEDIESCYCMDVIHKTAKLLRRDAVKTQIFIQPQEDASKKTKNEINIFGSVSPVDILIDDSLMDISGSGNNHLPIAILRNLESVEMPKKCTKLPGDTHIQDIIPELKQLIIQSLSLQKGNGSDWRMFAERIGLPETLINQWQAMKLNQPMRNVFNVWCDSPGATLRLLHRHLVSPQLKYILLAKRITDYYNVD